MRLAERGHDIPYLMWSLADGIDTGSTDPADRAPPIAAAALAEHATALRTQLERRLVLHAYRAPDDAALTIPRWMAAAPIDADPRPGVVDEAFYLAVTMHLHALAFDASVASSLRRRAVRVALARAPDPPEPHALAMVEAYARAYAI